MSRPSAQGAPPAAPLAAVPLTSAPPLALQLLISQAVCKLGTASSWSTISQLVESAEEWPEHAAKMTQQGYESAFDDMMGSKGLDASACSQPQARPVRKLIHLLYSELLLSLRDQILSSHSQEMKLRSEVSQIASGQVDSLLFNSSSQPIKDRILETQQRHEREREKGEDKDSDRRHSETTTRHEDAREVPQSNPAVAASGETEGERTAAGGETATSGALSQAEVEAGAAVESAPSGEVAPIRKNGEQEGEGDNEAEEDGDEQVAETRARKPNAPSTAGRKGQQKKVNGGRTSRDKKDSEEAVAVEQPQAGNETVGEEGEDDDRAEEHEEPAEGEDKDEDEELEEETKRPARKRTAAPKKGSRSHKRKASEPSPTADSPAPEESPDSVGPVAKRKRGGRKSRAETEAEQDDGLETKDSKKLVAERKKNFTRIVDTIRSLPFSNLFESRVTKTQAPNYSAAVKRSTCLKDIAKKIKSGEVSDNVDLMREFALLCANAVQFNGVDHDDEVSVGRQARELWEAFESEMNETLAQEFSIADGH